MHVCFEEVQEPSPYIWMIILFYNVYKRYTAFEQQLVFISNLPSEIFYAATSLWSHPSSSNSVCPVRAAGCKSNHFHLKQHIISHLLALSNSWSRHLLRSLFDGCVCSHSEPSLWCGTQWTRGWAEILHSFDRFWNSKGFKVQKHFSRWGVLCIPPKMRPGLSLKRPKGWHIYEQTFTTSFCGLSLWWNWSTEHLCDSHALNHADVFHLPGGGYIFSFIVVECWFWI